MGSNYIDSIRKSVVLKVIGLQGNDFYTKDISEHPMMRDAHSGLIKHSHYHALVGGYLKRKLTDTSGKPLLIELRSGGNRGSLWQLADSANTKIIKNDLSETPTKNKQVVRKGHYDTLEFMNSDEFLKIKELYESFEEIGGVYFRPVYKSISAVDLHPDSPKPRNGIGEDNYINIGMTSEFFVSTIKMKKCPVYLLKNRTISFKNFFIFFINFFNFLL